jgi:hypothetical protein
VFDWIGWDTHVHGRSPQQNNHYDCGVFMCQCIKGLATGATDPFPFNQEDMPMLRLRMVHELSCTTLTPRAAVQQVNVPDPGTRPDAADSADTAMLRAILAARQSACLHMRAMATYQQFYFVVCVRGVH